jgi:hypothetical protein
MLGTVEETYLAEDAIGPFGVQQAAAVTKQDDTSSIGDVSQPPSPPREPRTSLENWCRASKSIMSSVKVSKSFKTLRDMVGPEACLDPSCLTKIKQLAEGGFATVELSW